MSTETLSAILPTHVEDAAQALLQTACARGLTLATAESCTGGLLASLLTDVEGASHAFERGFIVYSEAAKCELLGVTQVDIQRCGAVSAEVACAMALGALAASRADVALAVTGFAGPGADGDEPGLVHFACCRGGREPALREEHFGDVGRGEVRLRCLEVALAMMRDAIDAD